MTRVDYIDTYGPMAVEACLEYPELYPSVLLAQAVLESANGNSALAKRANNHFGIKKGVGWNGDVLDFNTREYQGGQWVTVKAPFRKYATVTDSFRDRNRFLARNPRYTNNGVFSAADQVQQCKALLRAGYATDPEYATKLIALIDRYDLRRFDADLERKLQPQAKPQAPSEPPRTPAPEIPEILIPFRPVHVRPRPVDVPKIPIPKPPPVKRSWVDRLISWIASRH